MNPVGINSCGWFRFNYDPLTIVHVYTNQTITVKSGTALADHGTVYCDYSAPELSKPIPFEIELANVSLNSNYQWPGLRIAYDRIFRDPPSYKDWKFIDHFLTDGLTCWPEYLFEHGKFPGLRVEGGWNNAAWKSDLTRLFTFEKDKKFLGRSKSLPSYRPFTNDAAEPARWDYVDCEFPQTEARVDYATRFPEFVPYLGVDDAITGFQGRVPYLVTQDGRAYLIPIRFDEPSSGREGEPSPRATYVLLNDKVFFNVDLRFPQEISLLFVHYYGFRDLSIETSYWPLNYSLEAVPPHTARKLNDIFSNGFLLPYTVWRESLDSITDAWSAWPQDPRRVLGDGRLKDSYVGRVDPKYAEVFPLRISGGYSAGVTNDRFCVTCKSSPPVVSVRHTR